MEKINPYTKLLSNSPKMDFFEKDIEDKKKETKQKTGRPGRYTNAEKDLIPEEEIDKKISNIIKIITSEKFVSLTCFSNITNITYPIVYKWAVTGGLPHKKDPGPNNTTRWIGPAKEVGEWLSKYGRKAVATSIIKDRNKA